MAYDYVIRDIPIYKAALRDDWESVKPIFDTDETKLTTPITYLWETPLLIAVGTNRSHHFVEQLVERIESIGQADKLWLASLAGNNPLHYAAKVGNTRACRLLVPKKPEMTQVPNPNGNTPLNLAANHGNKDTLRYLLEVTEDKSLGDDDHGPYRGVAGGDLITSTIAAGFYDIAIYIVKKYPHIVTEKDRKGETALQALAAKPDAFPSGIKLGFWGRLVYSWFYSFNIELWRVVRCFALFVRNIHDIGIKYAQTEELVKLICSTVIEKVDHSVAWDILGSAITVAVQYGIYELIEECILTYPGIVSYNKGGFSLFIEAIKQRQERVYNLSYQMSGHKVFAVTDIRNDNDDTALHIVAKLAPPNRLNTITGAAMQMQRELQWFKEVEKFVEPSYRESLNKQGKTPRMVFTEEHRDLIQQGQGWMKDAASSCTVVATLIVTMAFSAAFTLPGGNDSEGKPLFLEDKIFILFAISDAMALFSSTTSVLMFLAILTSRYAEEDFLRALPTRMTIGLLSLFVSLAATMIGFSAGLSLALDSKITWIVIPLTLLGSIPVTLFVLLQCPLLVELVLSTYGPSIFRRQKNRWIH